ncbi:cysteine peptidase family C39 domain-containing protein [Treponema pedis]|uniref:Peptidase C39 domain-containing protein n=1 Tax=Treponema pedis TaxID=409322 RepID=A0A7S6WMA0_9SPIR|nr:hypothetical protein IFE08_07840 [Treponema pedis]
MKKDVVLQKDETDCAAACIATIARRYGKRIAVKRIRKFAHTDQEGTSGLGITKAAKAFGFDCRGVISSVFICFCPKDWCLSVWPHINPMTHKSRMSTNACFLPCSCLK